MSIRRVPLTARLLRLSLGRVDGGHHCGVGHGDGTDGGLVGDQPGGVDGVAVQGYVRAGRRQHAGLEVGELGGELGVGSFAAAASAAP